MYTHGLAGIKREAVLQHFGLDHNNYTAVMGFTLAHLGDPKSLSEDYQQREQPNDRKPLSDIWQP